MAKPFSLRTYLRVVGAAGVVTFAFMLGSFVQFLNADPVSGAVLRTSAPEFSVNQLNKGDRLPLYRPAASDRGAAARRELPRVPYRLETTEKMPEGCDPAFSPITTSSPVVAYGRCTV